ncbi:MAG: YegP family protein [Thermoplasmata archaeon]
MKFEVYQDKKGEYRWRLRADNYQIIASGEGYVNRSDCLHCIDLVKAVNPDTDVEDQT